MNNFSIDVNWTEGFQGPEEIRQTSALVRIRVDGVDATRVEDDWSKSVQSEVRLAAYPLAMWLAASWWRLRWEPRPTSEPGTEWRMAHEMPASGHGYLWPPLTFESDGQTILVTCNASDASSPEPVRYLNGFSRSLDGKTFERAIDSFVDLTIERLNAVRVPATELHALWAEVRKERKSQAEQRKLEALLGFNPGDAPEALLERLRGLARTAGHAAVAELAPACAGPDPGAALDHIEKLAGEEGLESSFARLPLDPVPPQSIAPWEHGYRLAKAARHGTDPISDRRLAELLGIPSGVLTEKSGGGRPPIGLAIRSHGSRIRLFFRRRNNPGLRFEAARFLGDQMLTPDSELWLPLTDAGTARQKAQRAFAAEFLCPIESLVDYLEGDFSPERLDDAGDYFGVSGRVIDLQLRNHGRLPISAAGSGILDVTRATAWRS